MNCWLDAQPINQSINNYMAVWLVGLGAFENSKTTKNAEVDL